MHHLAAQWIPPDERSSFVTSYLGSSVGLGIFYPLFGYILSTLSWEWVFYVSGMVGTVWYMGWLYFVYDSPAKHPRIDPYERQYIEKSLDGIVHHDRKGSVPWKEILRSKPIWTNVICQWGSVWGELLIECVRCNLELNVNFIFRSLYIDDTNANLFPCHSRMECAMGWLVEWITAFSANGFRVLFLTMV